MGVWSWVTKSVPNQRFWSQFWSENLYGLSEIDEKLQIKVFRSLPITNYHFIVILKRELPIHGNSPLSLSPPISVCQNEEGRCLKV